DNAGNIMWAHRTGGAVLSIAVSSSGIVYAGGAFEGPSGIFENQTLNISRAEARFIARFLTNGAPDWIQYFASDSTPAINTAAAVAVAGDGNVWLAATFAGNTTIGGLPLTNAGAADIGFASFSTNGTVLTANRIGGAGNDVVHAAAIYSSSL